MRILATGRRLPSAEAHGAAMRLRHLLRALSEAGKVDFLAVLPPRAKVPETAQEEAEKLGLASLHVVPAKTRRNLLLRQTAWSLWGRQPLSAFLLSFREARRAWSVLEQGATYDLHWFDRPLLSSVLRGNPATPRIVDYPDIHGDFLRQRLELDPGGLLRRRARGWFRQLRDRRDAELWLRLERRSAQRADIATVCSQLDSRVLGVGRRELVPNGYDPPAQPAGEGSLTREPVLGFVATMTYGPNADGARFLVDEVLPPLLCRCPTARILLVGRLDDRVAALAGHERVEVRGYVDDLDEALREVRILVAPIRFGSGTRIKILEAFAHRLPVVSTAAGAAGLEVEDGKHLLLADQAEAFAESCARLLADEALAGRLTENSYRLYWERYRWSQIRRRVTALAAELGSAPRGGG